MFLPFQILLVLFFLVTWFSIFVAIYTAVPGRGGACVSQRRVQE